MIWGGWVGGWVACGCVACGCGACALNWGRAEVAGGSPAARVSPNRRSAAHFAPSLTLKLRSRASAAAVAAAIADLTASHSAPGMEMPFLPGSSSPPFS